MYEQKFIDYNVIFRWYYRKKDGTVVRPKNGKPFPIKVYKRKQ
jgi:hypothetical protein